MPVITEAAAAAGRPRHRRSEVTDDAAAALGFYDSTPFYQKVIAAEGLSNARRTC
ncbi:hypothetical protein AB0I49_18280 [Streptomyces sp. NPDC050617]|uniref:hypothetical protein n=1 Tax=Streptomyces sp. NPDC050617 TaxID=3154628 RepID=UPI00343B3C15